MRSRGRQTNGGRATAAAVGAAIARHPREFVGLLTAGTAIAIIMINALFLQQGPHPAPIFAARPPAKAARPARMTPAPVRAAPAPAPVPARSEAQITADIQRELARRGFYDGAIDGIWGAKTDAGIRDFAAAAHVRVAVEPSEALLRVLAASPVKAGAPAAPQPAPPLPPARKDPIAAIIAPPPAQPMPAPVSMTMQAPTPPAPAPVAAPAPPPVQQASLAPQAAPQEAPQSAPPVSSAAMAAPSKRVLAIQRALADFGYGQIKPTGVYDEDTRKAIANFERERRLPPNGTIDDRLVRELAAMTGRPLE